MAIPKISVVIPAYNGSDYLGEAISSVLNQTYANFELIVVDDASPDDLSPLFNQFDDPRLIYLRHKENKGAVAARHTGVLASKGDILAFLDQDDLFHEAKLQMHYQFMEEHPDVGATYNARLEIRDSRNKPCGLWQPPRNLSLKDFVLGYPIAPSDVVLRREWALREEIWDDSYATEAEHVIFNGQEIVFGARLTLAGCQFGNVGRALNNRRFHSQRNLRYLRERCNAELACQELVFRDPRCPGEVAALRNIASANIYLMWAYQAFIQDEASEGHEFLLQAVKLKSSLVKGFPCELTKMFSAASASSGGRKPEQILGNLYSSLPKEIRHIDSQFEYAVAQAYMLKGTDAVIWRYSREAEDYFTEAAGRQARIDDVFLQSLTAMLLDYAMEFGDRTALEVVRNLTPYLVKVGNPNDVRKLKGSYWVNRAFQSFHQGEKDKVARRVFRGIVNDPKHLTNRGVLAMSLHSLVRRSR